MAKGNDAWGIEVGANAIKAMRLVLEGSAVRVAEYDILPFKKILTTPDLNVDEAVQLNLDQFLSRHDVAHGSTVISVPGHMAFARFAKLPPVEPKKIPDIVKFEAVQQIPFPIDQVEWDYQVFTQPDSPDVEVGIFAITKERVVQTLANYRAVNLPVHAMTLSPVAVYNAMAYDLDLASEAEGLIIVDIGTVSTDLIVVEGGDLWLRTVPIGGNNFTEALVRAFKLSFPKAEKLKREAGTSKYARQIFQAMRPVFADLVQEIQRSLGYYQSMNRDAKLTKLYGIGSTFRLPGLQKFLKQQLQLEVVRPDGFRKISIEGSQAADFSENAMNLVTAYGLALQGLDVAPIGANILPRHILKQRLWKAKQPWFAAAAAVLAIAAGASYFRYNIEAQTFHADVASHEAEVDRLLAKANTNVQAWRSLENTKDPRPRIENLRRVLDYRGLWPRITADIMAAAAAADANPVLDSAEYARIAKIPRRDRHKLYIESVDVSYGPAAAAGSAAAAAASPSAAMQPGVGQPWQPGAPPPPYFAGPQAAPGAQAALPADASTPGVFTITVKGYTPYNEGPGQNGPTLGDVFVNWLKAHADRPDRPYTYLVASNQVITTFRPRGATGGTSTGAPGGTPGGFGVPRPEEHFGFGVAPPGMREPSAGGGNVNIDVKSLLPPPPATVEPSPDDWVFTISWSVAVRSPDASRQGQAALPGAPGPAQPPTAPAPVPTQTAPGTGPAALKPDSSNPRPHTLAQAMEVVR